MGVVITTEHYGTPLFCPGGDINNGLINLAPSKEGSQQLVPLYWQNLDEVNVTGDDSISGSVAGGTAAMARRKKSPCVGGTHGKLGRQVAAPLPTHLEEDEENEEEEQEEPSEVSTRIPPSVEVAPEEQISAAAVL